MGPQFWAGWGGVGDRRPSQTNTGGPIAKTKKPAFLHFSTKKTSATDFKRGVVVTVTVVVLVEVVMFVVFG
jgi:hypothetical protein